MSKLIYTVCLFALLFFSPSCSSSSSSCFSFQCPQRPPRRITYNFIQCKQALCAAAGALGSALLCSAALRVADVWLVISFNEKQTRRIRNAAILSRSSNKFTAQQLPEGTLRRAANSKMANSYTKLLTHTQPPREYNWISMPEWLKINFMHRTKNESD